MATNFPTSLDVYTPLVDNVDDVMAAHINNPYDAIEALEAKVGIDSSAVTTSLDYLVNSFFVSGRSLYLYENVAPTGWTIVAVTDKVLAVKGGAAAYDAAGGTTAGSFTISVANMPAHTHKVGIAAYNTATGAGQYGAGAVTVDSGSAGGADGLYRPAAAVGIIVSKDA